eukprot:jgi/Botrbrau1/10436/Bobra.0133s0043.1
MLSEDSEIMIDSLGLCRSLVVLLALFASCPQEAASADVSSEFHKVDALMPDYSVDHEEAYLCTAVPLPDKPLKLVGIEPLSTQEVVHHMLLFGCEGIPSDAPVWDCRGHSVCSNHDSHVLYGWAKNAAPMHVPKGVGFRVGPGSGTKVLVLQVHYTHKRPEGDRSGVRLKLTDAHLPFAAGMMMYAKYFELPPGKPSHIVPNKCCYHGFEPAHGFAFRVHTHALGRSVYLDRLAEGGGMERLAEHSPQLPQGFTPLSGVTFWPGDRLQQACDYNTTEMDHVVRAGSTHSDEMCNLYMMMWAEMPVYFNCYDGPVSFQRYGPGGIPLDAHLSAELPKYWTPPPMGQVAGVAKGLNGTIWVLHRGDRIWDASTFGVLGVEKTQLKAPIKEAVVLQLDQDTGELVTAFGADTFYMPHMITVDRHGNVWVTDVALQQAIKFRPDGERLLTLGLELEPGHDKEHFCKPTQVALGNDGTVYVADGYCNARVQQFSPDGAYQGSFELPEGRSINNPHSLVIGDCPRLLFVADREGQEVHTFDLDSREYRGSWELREYGYVYGLTMGPYGMLFALTWRRDADKAVHVLLLSEQPGGGVEAAWKAEGVEAPHDLALVAAPIRLAVADRPLAVLIGETRPKGSLLHKFILLPAGQGGIRGGRAGHAVPHGAGAVAGDTSRSGGGDVKMAEEGLPVGAQPLPCLPPPARLPGGATPPPACRACTSPRAPVNPFLGAAIFKLGVFMTVIVGLVACCCYRLSRPSALRK